MDKGFDNINWKTVGAKAVEYGTYTGTLAVSYGASAFASVAIGGGGMALGNALGQGIDKGFENINLKTVAKTGGMAIATAGMGQVVSKVAGKVGSTVAAKASKYVGEAGKKIVEQVVTGYTMGASIGATADVVNQTIDIADGTQTGGYDLFQTLKSTFYGGVAGSVASVAINKLAVSAKKIDVINATEQLPSKTQQTYTSDLSHVTGKGAANRNKAIEAIIKEDFPDLDLTFIPEYSPFIRTGIASRGQGTQIGKNMFYSRAVLRDTILHEELHHRWWKKGIIDHHPMNSQKETLFYKIIEKYKEMRGWTD